MLHGVVLNASNAELNLICHLLALLGAHRILHVSRIRVNQAQGSLNVLIVIVIIATTTAPI